MNHKKTKKVSNGFFLMVGLLSLVVALGTGCGGGGGGGGGGDGLPPTPEPPPGTDPVTPPPSAP